MKNKNILDKVFICIILNLIPIALLGMFKISDAVYTILYAVVYVIQSFLLFICLMDKLCYISKKFVILLLVIILNCSMTILYDVMVFNSFDYNELLFSISFLFNIVIFIIGMSKQETTREDAKTFFEKMCKLGLISAVINLILNYKKMLSLSTIVNSYDANFSSFFPNRNQFGLFMLIMVISISLLMRIKYKKRYVVYLIVFIVNLILSMSRNSIIGLVVFFAACFYYKYVKVEKKITINKLTLYFFGLIAIGIMVFIFINNDKVNAMINNLFIRVGSLESGSGRFAVWKNGISIFSKYNPIFGVGRYKAIELNQTLYGSKLEYFHSIYVEKLACHGIVGLLTLIYLLRFTWKKIMDSKIDVNVRSLLKSSLISFFVFSIFETTTRFSIGYADSIYLIYFFTIPILISNIKIELISEG